MYTFVLYFHIIVIIGYLLVLIPKLYYLMLGKDETLLLYMERSRLLHIFILVFITVTGLYLGFEYDFSYGLWFTIKLVLLGITVFVGDYAFKNFSRIAGLFLILLLIYIIALSFVKSYDLVFHIYPYDAITFRFELDFFSLNMQQYLIQNQ